MIRVGQLAASERRNAALAAELRRLAAGDAGTAQSLTHLGKL